jgi:hypothetical protein
MMQARQQGWEFKSPADITKEGLQLVVALPPSQAGLDGAGLAEYMRSNPGMVLAAWRDANGRFSALSDSDREMALRALEQGTSFGEQQEFSANQAKIAEFGSGLDSVIGFDPSSALYSLYRNGVFSYIDSMDDGQVKDGYREELMKRLSGIPGLDFETALRDEAQFRDFLQGFLSLLSDGSVYNGCLYALPYFAGLGTDSRLYEPVAAAIEEFSGLPQELLKELHASGRLSRAFTEAEFRELLRDGRVQSLVDRDWSLPPGQEDASESARALRFFMTELGTLSGIPEQEKAVKYAHLYDLWTIAQNADLLQNGDACMMAREFYRVTGMEISSDMVRSAWEENRYAAR